MGEALDEAHTTHERREAGPRSLKSH